MKKQLGISMIEILVTIIVLSFGFLSLASFQLGTLNHLTTSNQHYIATLLGQSIGESIKANNVNAVDYDGLSTNEFNKDCSTQTCSIAEWDFWLWQRSFKDHVLPNVEGIIGINGSIAIISIVWDAKDKDEQEEYEVQVPL